MGDTPVTPLPVSARIAHSFKQLTTVAGALNLATDEFNTVTAPMDELLQKLNLGVECWVRYKTWADPDGSERHHEVGYSRINGRWGVALRQIDTTLRFEDDTTIERWAFKEAPRSMRLEAVHKLPELLDELVVKTGKATRKVKEGTESARDVMSALKAAAAEAGVIKVKKVTS